MTNQPLLPFTAFDHQALQKAQATNLRWCEEWGATLPAVAGIPVGRALTFDLIQLLNRSEIEQVLGPTPDFAAIEAEVKRRMETTSAHTLAEPVAKKESKRRQPRKPVKWEAKP